MFKEPRTFLLSQKEKYPRENLFITKFKSKICTRNKIGVGQIRLLLTENCTEAVLQMFCVHSVSVKGTELRTISRLPQRPS